MNSVTRRLPGRASTVQATGNVDFRKGELIYSSERMQWIKNEHPEHKLVFACGGTYMYWCAFCTCTVYEHEVTAFRSVVQGGMTGTTNIRFCPFCATWGDDGRPTAGHPLQWLKVGTKLKMHYRFGVLPQHQCRCGHYDGRHLKAGQCMAYLCECQRFEPDETIAPVGTGDWWGEVVET
jgi:hypothetical protein